MNSFRWEEAYEVGRRGLPDKRIGSESHPPLYIYVEHMWSYVEHMWSSVHPDMRSLPKRTLKAAEKVPKKTY